jgi:hypothetical protein
MVTVATCPHSQGNLHNHLWDLFFIKNLKTFFTWEVKQRVVLEVNFFLLKKKGPMGVVEGCLGYWCRMAVVMAIFASAFNNDNF